jgi:transposase
VLERVDRAWRGASVSLPWSVRVEGHITWLKLSKRQGYGRAGLDTLKRRFLQAA